MWSKKKNPLWRGATLITVALLVLSIGVATIAESWKVMLDEAFGTRSSTIVSKSVEGEDAYNYKADYENSNELVAAHKDLAERMQEEGSVLLKNNSTLPIAAGSSVTLFGMRSHMPQYGGQIGSSAPATQNVSLEKALTEKGFKINQTMVDVYTSLEATHTPNRLKNSFGVGNEEPKYEINEPAISDLSAKNATFESSFASYNDAAIVVIGRPSTEAADFFPGERGTTTAGARNVLGLCDNERAILDMAIKNFDKVIVLINSDSAMEIEELEQNEKVDSILWVGAVGNYGFLGVADVLMGKANPSGHLVDLYATDSTSSPAMQNFGIMLFENTEDIEAGGTTNRRGNWYVVQSEGIYTGYKYYETRYADAVMGLGNASSAAGTFDSASNWNYNEEVSYPFGYGMSYSTFKQTLDSVEIANNKKTAVVKVTVTNTGKVAGKDVVQVYAQSPYTAYDKANGVEKSAVQLMDFGKTKTLAPNESQTLTINIDMQNLASYDYINAKTYILDAGNYFFSIGNGSHEAVNNILTAQGYTVADGMDADGDAKKTYTWTWDAFDNYTFAVSKAGVKITNQLDDADLNYYLKDTVTYLSRNDWTATWPKEYVQIVANEALIKQLRNDTYEIKKSDDVSDILFGQSSDLKMADLKNADFDDYRWGELLSKIKLSEAMVTLVQGQNIVLAMPSIDLFDVGVNDGPMGFHGSLSAKSKEGSPWYVSATDENAKYETRDMPTAVVIGSTFSKELARENGVLFGNDSLFNGQTVIWAPGMNLHRSPYNGRNHEYYSEDAVLAGYIGSAMVNGALEKGLVMAPKHFAFNNQESNRAALAQFMNEQQCRENELRGFQICFENGAMGTMTSFSRVGATYANAHVGMMNNILRGEWDFNGYIVTDMINGPEYMTLKESIIAGVTVMDTSNKTLVTETGAWSYFTEDNIKNDALMLSQIKEGFHYLLYTIANSNAMNGVNTATVMNWNLTWWRGAYIASISVFSVLTVGFAALYVMSSGKSKKKED